MLREQKPDTIDFVHNTIKEFLAAEIFVEARDYSTLAHRILDDLWRQGSIICFCRVNASLPRGWLTE